MNISKNILVVLLGVTITFSSAFSAEIMTNETVIQLVKDGTSEAIILAAIKGATTVDFKTEVFDLQALSEAGVSDDIIMAMVERKNHFAQYQENPAQTMTFYAVQNGKQTVLMPEAAHSGYVKSKKNSAAEALKNVAFQTITMKALEAVVRPDIFMNIPGAGGPAQGTAAIGAVVGVGSVLSRFGGGEKGYLIQALVGENARVKINANQPTEFVLPVPGLLQAHGLYFTLEDVVLLQCTEHESGGRLLVANRLEIKDKEIKKVLDVEVHEMPITRSQGSDMQMRIKTDGLGPGNYALAFKKQMGKEIAFFEGTVYTFRVEGPVGP